jgi:hypothetical protein
MPTWPDHEDIVAWHYDPKGQFSVKSAYHALADSEEQDRTVQVGESSSSQLSDERSAWKKIWKLDCPAKTKQFIWRIAHNSLALKMNIKKGIQLDTRCPICWRFDGDGGHCFLKCKSVKHCWRDLQLEDVQYSLLQAQTARDFVLEILKLKPIVATKVSIMLWKWWDERNWVNAGDTKRPVSDIV